MDMSKLLRRSKIFTLQYSLVKPATAILTLVLEETGL